MKSIRLLKVTWLFSFLLCFNYSFATERLRVSIPKMSANTENKYESVLVDFARVLAKRLGQAVDIQLVPFSRSIYYVTTNKVDFHLPFIKPNTKTLSNTTFQNNSQSNFIYSDETIFYVNFVLYSHKNVSIDIDKLSNYHIETDSAHLPFFPGLKMGSNCIFCSLKKVQYKMTEGYIFADSSTDPLLRENKILLSSIKRQLYQRFEVKVLFPKTEEGQKLNKAISAIIAEMRISGELEQLLAPVNYPYDNWQL
jgi:hypothetical protein